MADRQASDNDPMENEVIHIELFSSPGCGRCRQTAEMLSELVHELGTESIDWRLVDVVEELDYAVALGVLATPAIAIGGRLVCTGAPNRERLRRLISETDA